MCAPRTGRFDNTDNLGAYTPNLGDSGGDNTWGESRGESWGDPGADLISVIFVLLLSNWYLE